MNVELNFGTVPVKKIDNIFLDGIAYLEKYDFSTANMSLENRVHAVSAVASICYQNPKAINSINLFNRLAAEAHSLPSSSFEFVPVLISESEYWDRVDTKLEDKWCNLPLTKYGEWINHKGRKYLLTNYRAVVYTKELYQDIDLTHFFNTQEECNIIKEYFSVFLFKVDFPTRSQMVRHRISWQELSRRFVSGERVPFEFYVSEKMKNVNLCDVSKNILIRTSDGEIDDASFSINNILNLCHDFYKQAIKQGVKPQEARRIIPQAGYTQIWGAFQPSQLKNYLELRLDKASQWEIQQTALAMLKANS